MQLERLTDQFDTLLETIGAEGDESALRTAPATVHNAS